MFVFDLTGEELKQVAANRVTGDREEFWGSPAVSGARLLIRSSKYLYCVMDKGQTVEKMPELVATNEEADVEEEGDRGRRGGGGRRDPAAMFDRMDTNQDDQLSGDELAGNWMSDRLKSLDTDGDEAVSREEFTSGIGSLFQRGGRGGRDAQPIQRPDRPQRPAMADEGTS